MCVRTTERQIDALDQSTEKDQHCFVNSFLDGAVIAVVAVVSVMAEKDTTQNERPKFDGRIQRGKEKGFVVLVVATMSVT